MAEFLGTPVSLGGGVTVQAWLFNFLYTPTTITPSTTSVTVSAVCRLRLNGSGAFASGNDDWAVSGGESASGTKSWNLSGDGDYTTFYVVTKVVSLNIGSTKTFSLTARMNDVSFTASDAVVSGSITLPARPSPIPDEPSGFTAVRTSDTLATLAWTDNGGDEIEVSRRVNGGAWLVRKSVVSPSTGTTDAISRGHFYDYRIKSKNSTGSSIWVYSDRVWTTPQIPSAPTAQRIAGGDVEVRPTGVFSPSAATWDVRLNSGPILASNLPLSQGAYVHPNPSTSSAWTYQVRARSGDGTYVSNWSSASNTVPAATPPGAPTNPSPNGDALNSLAVIQASWDFNSTDTSPQTAYEVRHRPQGSGGVWTTTGKITSPSTVHQFPAGTWASGSDVEWQVRTWASSATPSGFSATATFSVGSAPIVTVVSPEHGTLVEADNVLLDWGYSHPDSSPQEEWEVVLTSGSGQVIATQSGTGTTTQWNTGAVLVTGRTYTWQVRAASGGVWSTSAVGSFITRFGPQPIQSFPIVWVPEEERFASDCLCAWR